ncbi:MULTISPECIES: insulinase family protein [unclassified Ekhidna]|jgi:zinc protease|uniref:insulinase family protein n=1 Tax=unclassified Ekhidna TaxID=2632188 RepID=UPI0032DF35AD
MNLRNILTLVLTIGMVGAFAQVDRSKLPEPATPRPINIGDYETFELKNGLKVFIIENHKLPRVSFNLLVDREPLLEEDKVGYLGMVGQMMMRGTETRTKEQLDEEIDFIGASVFAGSTNVFASGLSKYQEKILELMTDVAFNPTFPEEELEKIRKQTLSGLASAKDDPNAIAGNLNQAIVYGKDHPYGEIQTEETTNNIKVDDLKNYHATYFKPNISYLAIVGDVDPKQMKKMVKTYFGSWEEGEVPAPTYETPEAPEKTKVGLVNRSASVQSVINITYPVVLPVGSDDAIKVRVMNQILGGGFSGKLNMNLREDKGYTYGSRSSLSSDELVSRFTANAEVRNEVTDSSIVQMIYEMDQMRNGEITDEELELAKNSISGSFSQSLERPQTVANFALNTAIYNLPADYYNTYLQKVQAVTIEDVKATAQKYLNTEKAYINVVGKASEVAESLKQFGELKYYDTYGNEVDPSLAKLPEGLTADKVIADYEKALGGEDAISQIENVTIKMSGEMMGRQLEMTQIMTKGMKTNTSVGMGGMTVMSSISDGNTASISQMGNKPPLDDATIEEQVISNALFSELALNELGAKVELAAMEEVNGSDAYVIEVELSKGNKYTVYFDTETGLKTRYSKTTETPQGAFTQTVDYLDYKEVNGVMFPHTLKQTMGPQKIEMKASEILVNQEISEETFKVE